MLSLHGSHLAEKEMFEKSKKWKNQKNFYVRIAYKSFLCMCVCVCVCVSRLYLRIVVCGRICDSLCVCVCVVHVPSRFEIVS